MCYIFYMSILWRYALHSYLRVFLLSIFVFLAVLFVARFKEIARFAVLTEDFAKTGLFAVYQIPLILPIAIPISALLTALLLFQRFSRSFELTALRSLGFNLSSIMAPFLLISIVLAFFNFSICARYAPFCRREAKTLLFETTTQNPLLLLKLQRAYLEKEGEGLLLIARHKQRLNCVTVDKLEFTPSELICDNVNLIAYSPSNTLIVENQERMRTPASFLATVWNKETPKFDIGSINFNRLADFSEMCRRISLSIAVFTFTLLGASFGIEQGRVKSRKNLVLALLLSLLLLLCYFLNKTAPLLSLIIHPCIWAFCLMRLRKVARGHS
jgi:lipopolysaccharide export system permease protein